MVLTDLGARIIKAISTMNNSKLFDSKVLESCLKEVSNALVSADVNLKLVIKLRQNIKKRLSLESGSGVNLRKIVQKELYTNLVSLLSTNSEKFTPTKGTTSIVMLVGLQGAGKTTTACKLSRYYKQQGFRVSLVCADTYRAGAFAQLKQNASRIKIPFYGSETESDAALIAKKGVDLFKRDRFDIIIVDTSGRHKNEKDLFKEMKDIENAVSPDHSIFVIDGTIGQTAVEQAKYFKNSVKLGSAIITKLDGNAKGGGALSAVNSAEVPVIFIGKGEKMTDLERFSSESFVKRLLGLGDLQFLMEELEANTEDNEKSEKMMKEMVKKGKITFRDLRSQLGMLKEMGNLSYLLEMIPGMREFSQKGGELAEDNLKNITYIMDSMRKDELDGDGSNLDSKKKRRLAIGSGRGLEEVEAMIKMIKPFKKMFRSGMMKKMMNMDIDPNDLGSLDSIMKKFGAGGFGGKKRVIKYR